MLPAAKRYVARDKTLCCPRQNVMLPAAKRYVAREDISNEKTLLNAFHRKAEIERRSSIENL
jgi:hypothetical protein